MGKKRRILTSPKFAALRKHRKFKGLVKANLEQEKIELEPTPPTPFLSAVEEPSELVVEPTQEAPAPAPVRKAALKPKRARTKASSKRTSTLRKRTTRRSTKKTE